MSMLKIKNTSGHPFQRATEGAIGFDLHAVLGEARQIGPGRRWKVPTGISIELPEGWGAFVMPRSGLGLHHGIIALTGVIDRDYRGELSVVLLNTTTDTYVVHPGDRIAQLVPVLVPETDAVLDVEELSSTDRGGAGFGSTGR